MTRRLEPIEQRFARQYVVAENGCWLWTGSIRPDGYAVFQLSQPVRRQVRSHRWSYEQKYGLVPAGLVLDHFACDTRHCVNPDHVRPVTQRENALRAATSQAATNIVKTHCPRGHELPPAGSGWRQCQTCKRAAGRRADAKRKQRRLAAAASLPRCSVDFCTEPVLCKGVCSRHYHRQWAAAKRALTSGEPA